MIREWLINARLREDFPKGISPRDTEDIEEIMESCCRFITEQFLNLELTYRLVGAQAEEPEKEKGDKKMFAKRKVKVKLRRRKIKKRGFERFWIGKRKEVKR
jgi:hypothetical protein